MCERLKVQPAELGYIEREQSAGVVEEHAKPPEPATPKPTPTPAMIDDTLKVFDRWLLLKTTRRCSPCSAPSPPTISQATRSGSG